MTTNAELFNFYEEVDYTDASTARNNFRDEIVRCKDCKHCFYNRYPCDLPEYTCNHPHLEDYDIVKSDHFCSYGERNE